MKQRLQRVLIANRGEIAVRVIRTLREMGRTSIAIFSEPDRVAFHVLLADEAYPIGPGPSRDSYLNFERVLETAKRVRADAIHPGYGFFAENAEFARGVRARRASRSSARGRARSRASATSWPRARPRSAPACP